MKIGESPRIVCGKCGSGNVVRPVNDPKVDLQCLQCGHTKTSIEYNQPVSVAWTYKQSDTVEF